jgi:hypothetical protein
MLFTAAWVVTTERWKTRISSTTTIEDEPRKLPEVSSIHLTFSKYISYKSILIFDLRWFVDVNTVLGYLLPSGNGLCRRFISTMKWMRHIPPKRRKLQ